MEHGDGSQTAIVRVQELAAHQFGFQFRFFRERVNGLASSFGEV